MVEGEVLVVVLNYNGLELTKKCISSINENTDIDFSIIVVDNGSETFDKRYFDEEGCETLVFDRNLGFDIAMNQAICQNPGYDYYVLMNNDTEVSEEWLKSMITTSKNRDAALVAPKLVYPDGTLQKPGFELPSLNPVYEEELGKENEEVLEVDGFLGAAFMIRSDVIQQIGYLDEVFTPGNNEEWDYLYRAKKEGFTACIDKGAIVIHKEEKTKEDIPSRFVYFMQRKNSLKYWLMNGSKTQFLRQYYKSIKHLGAGMVGYKSNYALEALRAYLEFAVDLPYLLKRRYGSNYAPSYYFEGKKDYSKRYSGS